MESAVQNERTALSDRRKGRYRTSLFFLFILNVILLDLLVDRYYKAADISTVSDVPTKNQPQPKSTIPEQGSKANKSIQEAPIDEEDLQKGRLENDTTAGTEEIPKSVLPKSELVLINKSAWPVLVDITSERGVQKSTSLQPGDAKKIRLSIGSYSVMGRVDNSNGRVLTNRRVNLTDKIGQPIIIR